MKISFVESNDSSLISNLTRIMQFIALIILWTNTSKMAENPNANKYYSLNVAASVLLATNLIILVVFNIYASLSHDRSLHYLIIALIIGIILVKIGYVLLWINTAKMQDDKRVAEFYNSNVASSVLIGVSILINIISKHFRFD